MGTRYEVNSGACADWGGARAGRAAVVSLNFVYARRHGVTGVYRHDWKKHDVLEIDVL